MGWVSPGRWLDAAIMGVFLMTFSALTLYLFSEFWGLCLNPGLQQWNIAKGMQKLFPFKRTFDVNLTHILLFALIICLLSLRPDFEAEPRTNLQSKSKKKEKEGVEKEAAVETSEAAGEERSSGKKKKGKD
eukprot:GHVU01083149.1.p2 GENE.GHVU01083149.1~~GHVU01083149.1.p2  ORF type:complete len:131 (+),score=18.95 GHVU01083149.1:312-704(+)